MQTDPIETLEAHLEREQRLLISGEIDTLKSLGDEKQAALDSLEASGATDAEALARLQRLAKRNMTMVEAALRGIRSARERIEEIRRVATNLDTYSSGGTLENLGDAPRQVERRA